MADDETPTDDTPTDDQTDEESDDQEQEEYKPPSKEEWLKARTAAKKAREERDRARSELAANRREKQTDEEKAKEREQEAGRYAKIAKSNAAVSALQGLGYGKAQARFLAGSIDLSTAELDDDGDIDLGDIVEDMLKAFPPTGSARSNSGKVTTGRGREDSQPKDDVDTRFAKRLLRSG